MTMKISNMLRGIAVSMCTMAAMTTTAVADIAPFYS